MLATTPRFVKKLFLDFVREAATKNPEPGSHEAQLLRNFRRKGFAILDEVDMLLHPLRSELNIPLGDREPLDLEEMRWKLPPHQPPQPNP